MALICRADLVETFKRRVPSSRGIAGFNHRLVENFFSVTALFTNIQWPCNWCDLPGYLVMGVRSHWSIIKFVAAQVLGGWARAWQKNTDTQVAKKVAHQNFTRINHEQFNLMLLLQLILYHITISSYYIFKPFRHGPVFLINKMLQNQIPTLHNELLYSVIIPVQIFLQMLLWWLPTVFNRREIRGGSTVEKVLQVVFLLPLLYNVVVLCLTMSSITIFFQDKILLLQQPWLYNRLQNLVDVYLEWHFAVYVTCYTVESNIRLEVVSDCNPAMKTLLILWFQCITVLNAVYIVLFPRLWYNP